MQDLKSGQDFISLLSDPDLLQLMLFACPDGVVATDEQDHIVLYTGASEQIFGFAPFEVMHRDVSVLFASKDEYALLREEIGAAGRVTNLEIRARRRDSRPFPAAISAAALHDRYGSYTGTIVYIRDYTEARSLQETLLSNNKQLGTMVVELDYAARHDQLTGLLYRASAIAAAEADLLRSGLGRAPFGVTVFDLDRFKSVNDSYGHLAGDRVLAAMAGVLRQTARQQDIVGRFGGEEFIAFLPGAGVSETQGFAERVRRAVAAAGVEVACEVRIQVTVSAGVAAIPSCADSLNEAIRVADDRLYGAKRGGRNRVVACDEGSEPGRNAA
jgi:diguanylate cyclase (GGDEF)-like protein/PAS domain S-box-containing protein